jgi:hypothetical protein
VSAETAAKARRELPEQEEKPNPLVCSLIVRARHTGNFFTIRPTSSIRVAAYLIRNTLSALDVLDFLRGVKQ